MPPSSDPGAGRVELDLASLAEAVDLSRCSATVMRKARVLLGHQGIAQDPADPHIFAVQPSRGGDPYRVQLSAVGEGSEQVAWITCTCPYGMKQGRGKVGCYHAAAVLLLLAGDPRRR